MLVNRVKKVLILSGFLVILGGSVNVADAYVSNRYVDRGGCYLQKEYNYFMNQWTTNEVCQPKFQEVPVKEQVANPFVGTVSTDNIYLGPVNRGYYTGNNNSYIGATYVGNNWNGYGSASNYLLGSFGGGIGSYGYYNNYYPNSVFTYTPTSYRAYNSWYYPFYTSPSYSYSDTYYDSYSGGTGGYYNDSSYYGGTGGYYDNSASDGGGYQTGVTYDYGYYRD